MPPTNFLGEPEATIDVLRCLTKITTIKRSKKNIMGRIAPIEQRYMRNFMIPSNKNQHNKQNIRIHSGKLT